MRAHRLVEVAAILGCPVPVGADPQADVGPDVVIDSRKATAGSLFVALPGEHVDGHDFVEAAADQGAVAAIVTRSTQADLADLVVDDAIAGLSELAKAIVAEAKSGGLQVLAITGSSGKTSTKDLLAQVLESAGETVAPVGSFNNEIGVPLTACRVDEMTRFLVSEMGARGVGHIEWLCSMTPPDVAAVLNVGTAHLGEFGSVDAIAQAKGEIIESLPEHGWAVLNADDPRVAAMAERTTASKVWFSTRPDVAAAPASGDLWVRAEQIEADELQRHRFDLVVHDATGRVSHQVALPLIGAHHVANALAAAAMAIAAGVEPEAVATSLSQAQLRSRWRMELTERADGAAVINDAYNANPDSMRAAIETVGAIAAARREVDDHARGILIVGDMLELGHDAALLHREVGRQAAEVGFDLILALGEQAAQVVVGAERAGAVARVVSRDEASSLDLHRGDVVLVKASRGLALEGVAQRLADGGPHPKSGEHA